MGSDNKNNPIMTRSALESNLIQTLPDLALLEELIEEKDFPGKRLRKKCTLHTKIKKTHKRQKEKCDLLDEQFQLIIMLTPG